jgi:hypothetical protein
MYFITKNEVILLKKIIIFTAMFIVIGIFLSGCVSKSPNNTDEKSSHEAEVSPASAQGSQNVDQNKINEMENKINSMQQQINDLQASFDRVGLPKPSDKKLIPIVPFRIEIYFAEWDVPLTYTFKEGDEVDIRSSYGGTSMGHYKLFRENNTIKLSSKKDDFYGLVLYDVYATAIYENGWIVWVKKYKVTPPKFNSETQKYELN